MPTTRLGQILSSYTVGRQTYTRTAADPQRSKTYNNPYFVLNASGDDVKGINEGHITVWGNSWNNITTVEFTWSGAKHLEFRLADKTVTKKSLHSGDNDTAAKLEELLIAFLVGAHVVGSALDVKRAYTQVQTAEQQVAATFNLASTTDFPPLGA